MVPIGSSSLGTLGELEVLYTCCRRCKRSAGLDRRALLGHHGDLDLRALGRGLRCTTCGAHGAVIIRATWLPR